MNKVEYIGMDAHQSSISMAVLDGAGKIVTEATVWSTTLTLTITTIISAPRESSVRAETIASVRSRRMKALLNAVRFPPGLDSHLC